MSILVIESTLIIRRLDSKHDEVVQREKTFMVLIKVKLLNFDISGYHDIQGAHLRRTSKENTMTFLGSS